MEKNLAVILSKLPIQADGDLIAQVISGYFDDLVKTKLDNIRVWFNNKGWTTSVGYLNAVNNLVLRASIQAQTQSLDFDDFESGFKIPGEYGISVINHPMNFTEKQLNEKNM